MTTKINQAKEHLLAMAEYVDRHWNNFPEISHYDSIAYKKYRNLGFKILKYTNNKYTTDMTAAEAVLLLLFLSTAFDDLN